MKVVCTNFCSVHICALDKRATSVAHPPKLETLELIQIYETVLGMSHIHYRTGWGKTGESEKQALCELGFHLPRVVDPLDVNAICKSSPVNGCLSLRPYSVSALFDRRFHRLLIPMQFACERRKFLLSHANCIGINSL